MRFFMSGCPLYSSGLHAFLRVDAMLSCLDAALPREAVLPPVSAGCRAKTARRSGYTGKVDKVRLGRALGYGTRHAAKTLAAVAEAATAQDPRRPAQPGTTPRADQGRKQAGVQPGTQTETPRSTLPRVPSARAVHGASRSVWGPLATFSSALWQRVTGLFFALIALAMANGAWRLRGNLHSRSGGDAASMHHLWIFVFFAVLFGYFAVSSFVRANLRERRAAR